jgi:hypothetical protein
MRENQVLLSAVEYGAEGTRTPQARGMTGQHEAQRNAE